MRPDSTSRTEADAAYFAALAGRDESFGDGPGDQDPNPLLGGGVLGPDPWSPFACQRCGSVNTAGMPEKCDGCGLRNYGLGVER